MNEELIKFLEKIILEISESNSDQKSVYSLLQENLDKLNLDFAESLRYWAKNYFVGESSYNVQAKAHILGNFGILIAEFPHGNPSENLDIAIACFEAIEVIFNCEIFRNYWAICKSNLGNAYGKRIYGDPVENLEKALLACEDALKIFTYEKFPLQWAEVQNSRVSFYVEKIKNTKNKFDNYEYLENFIKICDQGSNIFQEHKLTDKWAIIRNTLASAYCEIPSDNQSEKWELAINIYNKVLEDICQYLYPQQWAYTQMNLGIAYDKRKQGDRQENLQLAVQACQNALKFYNRDHNPFAYAKLQNNLGNAYRDQGLVTSAIDHYKLALEIHTSEIYPADAVTAARNLGKTAFEAGLWKEAIDGYTIAIKAVEKSRSWIKSDSRRQKIIEESIYIYQKMVQACINAGEIEKAFEYAERSRAKRLVDLMASNDFFQGDAIPPAVESLLQQYEELQRQIDMERDRHKSGNNRGDTRAAFQAYNEAIAALENQKQQIWEEIRRLDPVLAGEIQVSAPDFSAIQKLIDKPNTALLSFYTTDTDTHIFVLQQNQITLHTCTGQGIDTLQNWIYQNWLFPYLPPEGETKQEKAKREEAWYSSMSSILTELAERLQINTLINQHLEGIEELILIPHLLLHQIPLIALPLENHQYLGDKFLIRYIPSCQILDFCRQREHLKNIPQQSLKYGTVEDAEDNLPFTRIEGEKIAELYKIPQEQRLIGKTQATRENYRQLAQTVNVLHSSHHAQSRLDNPLESELRLADGSITLGQLMSPSWRLPDLVDVFLACCETHLGKPSLTDDIFTLSTGFLCAGAVSVVSTLWAVDDLATAVFSIFYYQHRKQDKSRPESLRQAQIQLCNFNKQQLKPIFGEAETREKELIGMRKKYIPGSLEYSQWEREYRMYARVNRLIQEIEKSNEEFPFSHPIYWAAFICQGLR
ncbi:MAG TPA: CHAT domain-containing tetratricopeptide repeat protein [Leptolyngbyaceae cyanobacterium]